jgi:hypothetical protein
MPGRDTTYQERGPQVDDHAREAAICLGIRRLQALGLTVTVAPAPPAAWEGSRR